MDILVEYLSNERSLYLGAAIIGAVSLIVGIIFLQLSPNFKVFAMAMLILGSVETAVFLTSYFNYPSKIDTQIKIFNIDTERFNQEQLDMSQSALKSFFRLKIIYSILIVGFAILISKLNADSILFGVLSALVLHLAFAITIDNFGEQYTKKYNLELMEMK